LELDLLFLYQQIQHLAAFIQKVNQLVEFVAPHVDAATFEDTRDAPMRLAGMQGCKDCTAEVGGGRKAVKSPGEIRRKDRGRNPATPKTCASPEQLELEATLLKQRPEKRRQAEGRQSLRDSRVHEYCYVSMRPAQVVIAHRDLLLEHHRLLAPHRKAVARRQAASAHWLNLTTAAKTREWRACM
jgi:hypothetical protein